jgi:hypothetical protein
MTFYLCEIILKLFEHSSFFLDDSAYKITFPVSIVLMFSEVQLEIKLSRGEAWDPINWFNPATCLCLSQAGPGFPTSYVVVFFVFSEFT